MNSVNLIGRLTRDPELRSTPSGTSVCSLGLAVDRAGPKQDDGTYGAGFFEVTAWSNQGEACAQYLAKGSQVGVSGELRFSQWETDGQRRSKVEVNAIRVDFVGSRSDNGGAAAPAAAASGGGGFQGTDDDIPFMPSIDGLGN